MYKTFVVACFLTLFKIADGQSTKDRCSTIRIEESRQFEDWLGSRMAASIVQSERLYRIPVVVHVIHSGEPIGEGFNYSIERIESQIRTLNEDFRRKEGTPGFNSHPDGADTRIEFVLAQFDPQGNRTDGIVRIDRNSVNPVPGPSDFLDLCAQYSYWDPERYLNIWCFDIGFHGIYAGRSQFPVSDLAGLSPQDDKLADGVFINAVNFGQGENTPSHLDKGRTLTHEVGHFLGLLHTFGINCSYSDYCDDTPPVGNAAKACSSEHPIACDGRPAMVENYMDYSNDACMNIFTNDQAKRMHTVLENSPRRKSLLTSPTIDRKEVTGIRGKKEDLCVIYPNPAIDKVFLSMNAPLRGKEIAVTVQSVLGKMLFKSLLTAGETPVEIPLRHMSGGYVLLTIETPEFSDQHLILVR